MDERLMKPAEVARVFGVDAKTVTRWAKAGRLTAVVTPGGHHRFREAEVMILAGQGNDPVTGGSRVGHG